MIKKVSLAIFLLISTMITAQETVTLSGYIKDASSGETLIGATAYLLENGAGATSNEYGYSLLVAPAPFSSR